MVNQNSPKLLKFATKGSTPVARKFHFTKKAIDALPNPTDGQRSYYYDDEVRGLAIAVSPLGKKTFILYRKVAGRPERVTSSRCQRPTSAGPCVGTEQRDRPRRQSCCEATRSACRDDIRGTLRHLPDVIREGT